MLYLCTHGNTAALVGCSVRSSRIWLLPDCCTRSMLGLPCPLGFQTRVLGWMEEFSSAPCCSQTQLQARLMNGSCRCTGVAFRMQTRSKDTTGSVYLTVSDPWKCQEGLREKLIPGRMQAFGKSRCSLLPLKQVCRVDDIWLASHTEVSTGDVEILCMVGFFS